MSPTAVVMVPELLQEALTHLDNQEWELAKRSARRIQRLNPYLEHPYRIMLRAAAHTGPDDVYSVYQELDRHLPFYQDAKLNLASHLLAQGRIDEARNLFDCGLSLPNSLVGTSMLPTGHVTRARLFHDLEYVKYLQSHGLLNTDLAEDAVLSLQSLLEKRSRDLDNEGVTRLSPLELLSIAGVYRRCLRLSLIELKQPILTSMDLFNEALRQLMSSPTERKFVAVDNFLTPEALSQLRAYLLQSSIWHGDDQKGKSYIGAYEHTGLGHPAIRRLALEMEEAVNLHAPGLKFEEVWAYKNINSENNVGVHADFSSLNVNLWLTPNEGNLDKSTGGLRIYSCRAPAEWSFHDYNDNTEKISALVVGSDETVIPYAYNRAVIFDPALFHASDRISFRPSYEFMRINVTFLFGRR